LPGHHEWFDLSPEAPRVGLEQPPENIGKTRFQGNDSAPDSAHQPGLQQIIDAWQHVKDAWPDLPEPVRQRIRADIQALDALEEMG